MNSLATLTRISALSFCEEELLLDMMLKNLPPQKPHLRITTLVWSIPKFDKFGNSAAVKQQMHWELPASNSVFLKIVPPNTPLFNTSSKSEARLSKDIETTVGAMNVSVQSFIPTKSYMDDALAKDEFTTYVKDFAWSKSLYMLLGA